MNDLTRHELDVKLELIETRMDARLEAIMSTLQALAERMDERFRTMEQRMEDRWQFISARMDQLDNRMTRLEQAITSLKTTMIITAISASMATVFGVAAFNATLQSNMLNAYDAGQSNARIQAELSRQVQETGVLLRKIQERGEGAGRSEEREESRSKQ